MTTKRLIQQFIKDVDRGSLDPDEINQQLLKLAGPSPALWGVQRRYLDAINEVNQTMLADVRRIAKL
jgi:hypothetical protein